MDFRSLIGNAGRALLGAFKESSQATYTQSGQTPVVLDVVLTNPSELTESAGVTQVIASEVPVVELLLEDLDPLVPKRGDTISLGGKTYRVEESHPDGYGWAKLHVAVIG